ncbi:MAG: hypothetical protein O2978_06155 [Bacteroidetes bacterium]|nr:hypothetical protein [Bacteroidota bacterium]
MFITVPNYSPLVGFSYFSAVGVMGIITYGAYILVYFNGLKRIVIFTIVLFVSMFLGHASSFFSLIAVFLVQFYISFTSKQRLITFFLVLVFMLILLQLPQFNDGNANWRLMYWSYIINNAIVENYLILGNGFGRPFMSMSFAQQILDEIGSFNMLGNNNPLVRWESPPHNSFLTIIFHIGLIPAMLLLFPIKSLFKQILLQNKSKDKKKLFLLYCLVGSVVWASFNVVLELPHSAVYFWLIYFTYAFYERKQTKI